MFTRLAGPWQVALFLTLLIPAQLYGQDPSEPTPRAGGRGRRGPDASMRADQQVFHYLLDQHASIHREVKMLENGVETTTESDNAEVAVKIQEHVSAMHQRVITGRGLRFWDHLFSAIFQHHDKIKMRVENTQRGVKVISTSDDPFVVKLIQAHASVVSRFVERGFDEAHENHAVPPRDTASETGDVGASVQKHVAVSKEDLAHPIIAGYGGVALVEAPIELPRAGLKVVMEVTAAPASPHEVNQGLDRAARLLNLYGVSGLTASDIRLTVVLHGEATRAILTDQAWTSRYRGDNNPNLPLVRALQDRGVEVIVCGQALHRQQITRTEVSDRIPVALSAMSVLLNRQADGFGYLSVK